MSWENTEFRLEQSCNGRTCNLCKSKIPSGKWLLIFNSNSQYSKNACMKCVGKALFSLCNKNKTSLRMLKKILIVDAV